MKFHGQRWEYRIGNTVIFADNALTFSLRSFAKERLIVNDEVVQSGSSTIRQVFREPWLTMVGEGRLNVIITGRLFGIHCKATLDEKPLEPFAYWISTWKGESSSWPHHDGWGHAPKRSWIVR